MRSTGLAVCALATLAAVAVDADKLVDRWYVREGSTQVIIYAVPEALVAEARAPQVDNFDALLDSICTHRVDLHVEYEVVDGQRTGNVVRFTLWTTSYIDGHRDPRYVHLDPVRRMDGDPYVSALPALDARGIRMLFREARAFAASGRLAAYQDSLAAERGLRQAAAAARLSIPAR